MRYIRWFNEIRRDNVAEVGGKAANLGELVSLGVNVPPGFAVTTEAYRRFFEQPKLRNAIDCFLAELRSLTLPEVESKTGLLRRIVVRQPVPHEVVDEVKQAYQELSELLGSKASHVSVRSSATSEDLAEASFAGIHSSFLNVSGIREVIASVRRCWASLWSSGAVMYRARCGFDHSRVAMGVIVQQMIPADISGVMFTCNPVTGERSEIMINSCWGLGESVVSGRVTPDFVVVDKATLQVLERNTGVKGATILPKQQGGVYKVRILREHAEQHSLTDEQTRQLAELGLYIEEKFGLPQDIEWVIAGDELYIVQSRPVFMLLSRHDIWLHKSPAQISIDKPVIEKKLMLRQQKKEGKDSRSLYLRATRLMLDWKNTILPSLVKEIKAIERLDFKSMSDSKLASHFQEVISANRRHFNIRIKVSELIDTSIERLASFLKSVNLLSPEQYPMLLVGFTNKIIESDMRLRKLAMIAPPAILNVLRRGPYALNELESWEEGARWREEFNRYLEEFGHLSSAKWDIMAPTYREDPEILLNTILNYASAQSSTASRVSALPEERDTLVKKVLEGLPDEERSGFLEALKIAQRNYPIKDDRDFYYLRSLAQVRRVFKEAGLRLQRKGLINSVDDVFFLDEEEIPNLLRSGAVNAEDIRARIKAEKLRFNERIVASALRVVEAIKPKHQSTEKDFIVLKGLGTSPGMSTGRARIVRSFHEFPDLKRGDILVCPAATPAWAPVFGIAGGIVTDVGGILSHGAILAREFQIPAIVSTVIATRVIREGQKIIVNGYKGLVYIPSEGRRDVRRR